MKSGTVLLIILGLVALAMYFYNPSGNSDNNTDNLNDPRNNVDGRKNTGRFEPIGYFQK